jgi:hypothetical protein
LMVKSKKKKEGVETVLKGNHLTVTTKPNGSVNLSWDWDALLKEVVQATAVGQPVKKETKKKTKK